MMISLATSRPSRSSSSPPTSPPSSIRTADLAEAKLLLENHRPVTLDLSAHPLPELAAAGVARVLLNLDETISKNGRKFQRYGKCGMEMAEILPHIGSCADDIALSR